MNTLQIHNYMITDSYIENSYGGIFSSNNLPSVVTNKPKIYVFNTDPDYLKGSHWISIYFPKNDMPEYFDSMGLPPDNNFEEFILSQSNKYRYNSFRLQGDALTCGHFVLMYSFFRTRGYRMLDIIDMFTDNLTLNDILVVYFYQLTK